MNSPIISMMVLQGEQFAFTQAKNNVYVLERIEYHQKILNHQNLLFIYL